MSLALLDSMDASASNGHALSKALHDAHEHVQLYLQRSIAVALFKRRWEQVQYYYSSSVERSHYFTCGVELRIGLGPFR